MWINFVGAGNLRFPKDHLRCSKVEVALRPLTRTPPFFEKGHKDRMVNIKEKDIKGEWLILKKRI